MTAFAPWTRADWRADRHELEEETIPSNNVCPVCLSPSRRFLKADGREGMSVCISVSCGFIFSSGNNSLRAEILAEVHADLTAGRGVRSTARRHGISKDTVLRYKYILKHCGVGIATKPVGELMKVHREKGDS